jgi:hypothetical protein
MAQDEASPSDIAPSPAYAAVKSLYASDLASRSLGIEIVDVAQGRVRRQCVCVCLQFAWGTHGGGGG